ncbi:MAG: Gfo/Idh/MocA family oxidoreductase, partial [bacterium]|nr:Gfo/Idh/MocA family oxidoreductase [bacterium]
MALRIGQVGSDGHQKLVLNGIPKIDGASLIAVAKGHPEDSLSSVKNSPAFTPDTTVYETYQEMLAQEDLDLVSTCRPFSLNAEVTVAAAEKGIHIASEKPLATTEADLDAIEQAVKKNGVRLTPMFSLRLSPVFRAAKQAVAEGLIGEPILATGQKSYQFGNRAPHFKTRETYGGTIPWVAIHAIDFVRWVSGLEYTQVAALHGNLAHPDYPGCEDHGGILFQLSNGGTAMVNLDYLRPTSAPGHGDDRLRIAGSEGVIEVCDCATRVHLIRNGEAPRDLLLPDEMDYLVDLHAELTGQGEHIIGPDEGIKITRICLKAREAADTG